MTTHRVLPIINLVGCILITGLILVQWLKERGLNTQIKQLNQQLVLSKEQTENEKKRASALDQDVAQLKESIESTAQAKREIEEAMAKLIAERDSHTAIQMELAAASEQMKIWIAALEERDAKILALDAQLKATRQRLDEAVAKLKAAANR